MPRSASRDDDPLLKLWQVADELGVSVTTAWRLARDGDLPSIDVGRRRPLLRVRTSAVEEFKRAREVRPIPRRARGRPAA
jgi:excisionase family DNA binding protein